FFFSFMSIRADRSPAVSRIISFPSTSLSMRFLIPALPVDLPRGILALAADLFEWEEVVEVTSKSSEPPPGVVVAVLAAEAAGPVLIITPGGPTKAAPPSAESLETSASSVSIGVGATEPSLGVVVVAVVVAMPGSGPFGTVVASAAVVTAEEARRPVAAGLFEPEGLATTVPNGPEP
ncbi:MAG: hypothetical protein AAFR47_25040, partial [Pseudomonadota bacterium]